jgi:hypothetical protein
MGIYCCSNNLTIIDHRNRDLPMIYSHPFFFLYFCFIADKLTLNYTNKTSNRSRVVSLYILGLIEQSTFDGKMCVCLWMSFWFNSIGYIVNVLTISINFSVGIDQVSMKQQQQSCIGNDIRRLANSSSIAQSARSRSPIWIVQQPNHEVVSTRFKDQAR